MLEEIKKMLSLRIFNYNGIRFSEEGFKFNLHKEHKEAPLSPNYVDLRGAFRNRELRQLIASLMVPRVLELKPDLLIDIPESVTPLVTTISDMTGIPMISIRSEALKGGTKDHGTEEAIKGNYKQGQTGLIFDDVVSSFAFTKFKAIPIVRAAGIILLPEIEVVIDREEGGKEKLAKEGFGLRSILGLHSDITRICREAGLISDKIVDMSVKFAEAAKAYSLADEKVSVDAVQTKEKEERKMAELVKRKSEDVMIIFPVDVATEVEAIKLIVELHKDVDAFKIGLELMHNIGTPRAIQVGKLYGSKVFADSKLPDIPNTSAGAARALVRHGVEYFNVMASSSEKTMAEVVMATDDEAKKRGIPKPKVIAVLWLTSIGPEHLVNMGINPPKDLFLMSPEEQQEFMIEKSLLLARNAINSGVDILLTSGREAEAIHKRWPDKDIFTPGMRLSSSPPDDQQRTMTPYEAVRCGSVGIIIGRPIRKPEGGKTREQVVQEIRQDIQKALT